MIKDDANLILLNKKLKHSQSLNGSNV